VYAVRETDGLKTDDGFKVRFIAIDLELPNLYGRGVGFSACCNKVSAAPQGVDQNPDNPDSRETRGI
jgi:hypothetical protein